MATSSTDSNVPGMACPGCGARIVLTMDQLLSGMPVVCMSCNGRLTMDRAASREALQVLGDLDRRLREFRVNQ